MCYVVLCCMLYVVCIMYNMLYVTYVWCMLYDVYAYVVVCCSCRCRGRGFDLRKFETWDERWAEWEIRTSYLLLLTYYCTTQLTTKLKLKS